ncbi:MAG: hypothetical protein OEZ34_03505, partial [Spirochaetia bacterium]|nr:hypothetical protein [Spirochaetia bacterium]
PVNDYYIYYLSLGKTKSAALEEGLKTVSPRVKTLESKTDDHKEGTAAKDGAGIGNQAATDDPKNNTAEDVSEKKGGELPIDEIAADIKKQNFIYSLKDNMIFWIALFGLLLIAILFLLISLRKGKFAGRLVYKPQGPGAISSIYNLKKIETGKLIIGSKRGNNLRISDLGIPKEIVLKPIKKGGLDFLRPVGKSSSLIEFLDQKTKGRISFGDKFRIGNYIFEYNNGKEN